LVDPLIVDQKYRIVGGHQRLKVLKQLRIEKAPVVKLHITNRDLKTLNLALNKISGEWDNERLAPLLEELSPLPEFQLTGFSEKESNLIIESFRTTTGPEADYIPPPPKKPKARTGDLYKLGRNRLLCGDSTNPEDWKRLMESSVATLAITDPPFGVGYGTNTPQRTKKNRITGKRIPEKRWGILGDENHEIALNTMPLIFQNLHKELGSAYIFAGTQLLVELANWMNTNHIHYPPFLVWVKNHSVITWQRYHAAHEFIIYCGPGSKPGKYTNWYGPPDETTVWNIPIDTNNQTRLHPIQKPVALYERGMINSSAPNDIVVDPFAGSGTCLIAAENHQRRAFCMEIDPTYVDVAIKRWENFTGRKAERTNST